MVRLDRASLGNHFYYHIKAQVRLPPPHGCCLIGSNLGDSRQRTSITAAGVSGVCMCIKRTPPRYMSDRWTDQSGLFRLPRPTTHSPLHLQAIPGHTMEIRREGDWGLTVGDRKWKNHAAAHCSRAAAGQYTRYHTQCKFAWVVTGRWAAMESRGILATIICTLQLDYVIIHTTA